MSIPSTYPTDSTFEGLSIGKIWRLMPLWLCVIQLYVMRILFLWLFSQTRCQFILPCMALSSIAVSNNVTNSEQKKIFWSRKFCDVTIKSGMSSKHLSFPASFTLYMLWADSSPPLVGGGGAKKSSWPRRTPRKSWELFKSRSKLNISPCNRQRLGLACESHQNMLHSKFLLPIYAAIV